MEILIVDDSSTIRLKFKSFLNVHGLNMPDMDGMTFIEIVASNEKTKDLPILVYTTELSQLVKKQAKSLGVKAWIPKPFNQNKILEVIEKILLN